MKNIFIRRRVAPLPNDADVGFLLWIISLMVFLATLSLAGAIVLNQLAVRWKTGLYGSLTVEIAAVAEGATLGDTSRRVARALTLLELTEGVNEAAQLPVSETAMLIEPWLGEDLPLADLPLPRLIDVRLAPGADIDLPTLRRRLREAVPGAKLDDHGAWMTDLVHLASAVEAIARVLMLVIGAAGALAVAAATKAKLAANASAVDLLHLIGATDRFIARQFERQVLTTAALAGVIGLLLALATLVLIGHTGREIETMLLPDFSFTKGHKAALAAIPLIAGTIAIMTARLTVLANLKRKP